MLDNSIAALPLRRRWTATPPPKTGWALIQPLELGDFLRRQLAEIEVALGVAGDAVRAVDGAAAAPDQLAVEREQADAGNLVGHEHQVAIVDPDLHRVIEVAPLAEIVPGAVEQLDAVVLAVAHQHAVPAVDCHGMRRGEGAGAIAVAA